MTTGSPSVHGAGLGGSVAVVTGAGSGIGRAIAVALAKRGASVCAVARSAGKLQDLSDSTELIRPFTVDVTDDEACRTLIQSLDRIDILIHAAGVISLATIAEGSAQEFDRLYRTNLRAPFVLTQNALPHLRQAQGQVVFVNSTAGVSASANTGLYAATKHGLKALADSLREEVNDDGIRVLSVFPGRTATPMQAKVFETEGKRWRPQLLMQPEDVAEAVLAAIMLPRTAEVTNLFLRPLQKV